MTTYKAQLKDDQGNTVYPDVGIDLDNVVTTGQGQISPPTPWIQTNDIVDGAVTSAKIANDVLSSISSKLDVSGDNATKTGVEALITKLGVGTSTPNDDMYYISQNTNLSGTYYLRKHSALAQYIIKHTEDGSGRNAVYFRDGTMITYRTVTATIDITTAWGSLFYGRVNDYYTFTSSSNGDDFISAPAYFTQILTNNEYSIMPMTVKDGRAAKINDRWAVPSQIIAAVRPSSQSGVPITVHVAAIGRWKE